MKYLGQLNGYKMYKQDDGMFVAYVPDFVQYVFEDEEIFLEWLADEIEDALV